MARVKRQNEAKKLGDENARLRAQLGALEAELGVVAAERRQFMDRYVALERQAANLSSLHVASHRLHESVDRQAVLQVIEEVVAAIIGSEELAIFELHPRRPELTLVSATGVSRRRELKTVPLTEGVIGRTVRRAKIWVAGSDDAEPRPLEREAGLTACIPLMLGDRVTGVIAIFRLLPQKQAYEPADHELFELLGTHAAMALYATRLRAEELR